MGIGSLDSGVVTISSSSVVNGIAVGVVTSGAVVISSSVVNVGAVVPSGTVVVGLSTEKKTAV